jgi:hypothetical protein
MIPPTPDTNIRTNSFFILFAKLKEMSVMLETPLPLPSTEEALASSFYIPPTQDDDTSVFSFHARAGGIENIRFSKKNYAEGYRCIVKQTKINKSGKAPLLEYFTTKNVIGHPIRNACTGYLYSQYHVGRFHEYLFFKARLCTEDSYEAQTFSLRQASYKTNIQIYDKSDPDVLFYDSPEEYETHHQTTLSQELKDQWRARYEKMIRYLEKTKHAQTYAQDSHIKILSANKQSIAPPPGIMISDTKNRPPSPNYPPPGY